MSESLNFLQTCGQASTRLPALFVFNFLSLLFCCCFWEGGCRSKKYGGKVNRSALDLCSLVV